MVGKRVLVVEDEVEARELLVREVSDCGYSVEAAADAQQAMDAMARDRHEIVLADIRLPGMDGMRLTRWIKELSPKTEVILMTGYATVETAAAALRLGACDYLLKPLSDLNEIRESLARASERLAQHKPIPESERIFDRQQLLGLLDLLPLAVLLVDHNGLVRGQNRFARHMLQQQCGLAIGSNRRLVCTQRRCTAELEQLLNAARQTSADEIPQVVGGMRIASPGFPGGLPLLVVKLSQNTAAPGPQQGAMLVALPAPELGESGTVDILTSLYGLTPTEARLATHTLRGSSLEQAARELGITEATARTHLRHIFAKTNTSRQGELVSALLSGPAMLRPLGDIQ